jgi:hypothetical protein
MIEKWITSIGPLAALFPSETKNIGPLLGAKTIRSFRLSYPTASCGPAGESQRSAACLSFRGATIATVDEHIRSAHRGVGA